MNTKYAHLVIIGRSRIDYWIQAADLRELMMRIEMTLLERNRHDGGAIKSFTVTLDAVPGEY